MDDAVAAWQASLRVPAPSIPSTDKPQLSMPTATGRVVLMAGDGRVYWPIQLEAAPIEAPDEPPVFLTVAPDVICVTAGYRLLLGSSQAAIQASARSGSIPEKIRR